MGHQRAKVLLNTRNHKVFLPHLRGWSLSPGHPPTLAVQGDGEKASDIPATGFYGMPEKVPLDYLPP